MVHNWAQGYCKTNVFQLNSQTTWKQECYRVLQSPVLDLRAQYLPYIEGPELGTFQVSYYSEVQYSVAMIVQTL